MTTTDTLAALLAALPDVAALMRRLQASYLSHDRVLIDRTYRAVIAAIADHPRLDAADRARVVAGFQRVHEQRPRAHGAVAKGGLDWGDFVEGLPAAGSPAVREAAAALGRPAPPVHWSVVLLDGDDPTPDLFVELDHAYTIETGLGPAPAAGALASSLLAADGLPDGTAVTFVASCPQAILRGHDELAGAPTAHVTHTAIYDARTGRCPPARFGLIPTTRGRLTLTISVVTDNAIRASTVLTLQATPGEPAPPPPPIALAPAALTGPAAALRFELTPAGKLVVSDGRVVDKPRDPSAGWSELVKEAILVRKELVALSRAYRADPAGPTFAIAQPAATLLAMARLGARLHKRFFGRPGDGVTDLDTQAVARAIAGTAAGARLQLVAAFQPFPWAVFYDGAYRGRPLTDDPASVDPACFWGHRFDLDRVIVGHVGAARPPAFAAPLRVQACLNPHLDDEQAIAVLAGQRAMFDGIAGVAPHPRVESTDQFVGFLRSDTACELLYVFCHASAAVTLDALFTYVDKAADTQARLLFEPARPIDVAAMQDHRDTPLGGHPLVFLNACASTGGDQAFQSPMLEQFLLRWQATGVLGTDWEVPTVFADAFARRLMHHFLRERRPIGEALRRTSDEAFAQGNPFPLVYALHARPELTLTGVRA